LFVKHCKIFASNNIGTSKPRVKFACTHLFLTRTEENPVPTTKKKNLNHNNRDNDKKKLRTIITDTGNAFPERSGVLIASAESLIHSSEYKKKVKIKN